MEDQITETEGRTEVAKGYGRGKMSSYHWTYTFNLAMWKNDGAGQTDGWADRRIDGWATTWTCLVSMIGILENSKFYIMHFLMHKILICYFYVSGCGACMCIYALGECSAHRGQKRAFDPLESSPGPQRSASALNCWATVPVPLCMHAC